MSSVVKWIVWLNTLVLMGFMVYAFSAGNIDHSGPILFGTPWGLMTLVDLYAGFVLFALFIYSQEATFSKAAPWMVALMLLGNLVACIYLLLWLKRKKNQPISPDSLAHPKTNIKIRQ